MTTTLDMLKERAAKARAFLSENAKPLILVGTATCGRSAGSLEVLDAFRRELEKHRIDGIVMEVGCIGLCYIEPIVCIDKPGKPGVCYGNVTEEKAAELVESWLVNDDPRADYALGTTGDGAIDGIPKLFEIPVFKLQVRRTLRNCGFIDPTEIDQYLAKNGYTGITKALAMGPEGVIEEIKQAGLRGRGGAGFPAWRKWSFCREAKGDEKYLICNADEGDPGAFMNRSLLEGDPHALLEGMLIAGFAIGARTGIIYCRAEYPLALERLATAIGQAKQYGLIGNDILGSGFDFAIKVKEGAGAFVCGEETALIASVEGKRGMPRPRPPFPAISGAWGKPTIINNVETLACTGLILQNGAEWFTQYGSEKSKGTKTFALVGKVKHTGLVEVPLGITLKEMIFDIGGGLLDDKPFKAVQTGGPSGGCIPRSLINTTVDYDSLQAAGTIMGSGGMVAMDESTCMVDFARYFLDFAFKESCGECSPCRLGTKQLLDILTDITKGKGSYEDIELLLELSDAIKKGALCGLGQTAPNPVLTTIRYFRDEYEAHTKYKRCPAVVCKEIISSPCQHVCPISTEAPVYIALIAQGRYDEAFDIILKDNPLPSVCGRVCDHQCEAKCQAGRWGKSIAIRALKRFAADHALKSGAYPAKSRIARDGEKVAVVGAGPAGLTAGYFLAQKGYDVTIFEALPLAGGALAVYIPEFRLPLAVLEKDIENIRNAGVTIETGVRIGTDKPFDELTKNFKAVFVAAGAHKPRSMGIPGEHATGVIEALDFLRDAKAFNTFDGIGKRVGVIGGGNAAIDSARVASRVPGCETTTVIYRRTLAEMPAFEEEIHDARHEGVELQFLTAPVRVVAENGTVKGLECIRMELGDEDASGRRRPVPIEGSEFVIDLDTIIVAIGEEPDASFLPKDGGYTVARGGNVVVNGETLATGEPGVFAGGDVATGASTVIKAIEAGRKAADMIDRYLRGEKLEVDYHVTRPSVYIPAVVLTEEELDTLDRPEMPCLPLDKRRKNFLEVEEGLTTALAVGEARRCLRCDLETQDAKNAIERQRAMEVAARG